MEQLNATSVYKDWDDGEDTLENRKRRYENCKWEMILGFFIRRAFKMIITISTYIVQYSAKKKIHTFSNSSVKMSPGFTFRNGKSLQICTLKKNFQNIN